MPFRAAGGFSPRLWLGGEEELLCTDLVTAGYWLCYLPAATVHHQASHAPGRGPAPPARHQEHALVHLAAPPGRRRVAADRRTGRHRAPRRGLGRRVLGTAVRGLPWVLRERRPVPPAVEARIQLLDAPRRTSAARRYVG